MLFNIRFLDFSTLQTLKGEIVPAHSLAFCCNLATAITFMKAEGKLFRNWNEIILRLGQKKVTPQRKIMYLHSVCLQNRSSTQVSDISLRQILQISFYKIWPLGIKLRFRATGDISVRDVNKIHTSRKFTNY